MKIASIIVTYNRLSFLKKSIKESIKCGFDYIVIVNNNSTDGTNKFLENLKVKNIYIINMEENVGGAGGFYYGFKYVVENLNADWIVCYDDDAYPLNNVVKEFKNINENLNEDVVAIASAVYLPNGSISKMNIPRLNFLKKFRIYIDGNAYKKIDCIEVFMSSFVGFFIKTEYIKTFSHFPKKELFIYGDDLLYTLRISQNNKKIIFCPNIKFIHDCMTLKNDTYNPMWKVYFTYRNGIILYKNIHIILGVVYAILKFISFISRVNKYKNKKLYKKYIILAIIDAFKNKLPSIDKIKDLK